MDKVFTRKKLGILEQQDHEVSFTEIETQCILQFIQSKTPVSIGQELGLNQSSVRFCLMNAGQKLLLVGKSKQ
ncbi:MAG TPA: hypothetical protein VHE99_06105 [Gammaproteobacteria bacterium]|nr:hypothetical protein [Gammaproteobacteria bacterium]